VDFKRPPRETFAEIIPPASGHMRLRISPDVSIALGLRVKRPGEGMNGQDVELILTEQATAFIPPYQRLLGDAMHGIGDLFGRQDIVDAQWRIVEPVLDEVAPPVTYAQGSWGPEEANQLIGPDGPWHNPKPAGLRP
jgi:glucose-6-phosphate 1-dehydrogenase